MNIQNPKISTAGYIVSLIVGSAVVFLGLVLISRLLSDGLIPVATAVGGIIIFLALVTLRRTFSPYRWMAVALVFVALFTVYPIVSTLIISTSNMSGGHLFTKQQALSRLESKTYKPDGASVFSWWAYKKNNDSWLLLLRDESGRYFLAEPEEDIQEIGEIFDQYGALGQDGLPLFIHGYNRVSPGNVVSVIDQIGKLEFRHDGNIIKVVSLKTAEELVAKYQYNPVQNTIVDAETGVEYSEKQGTFISSDGDELIPGFKVNIGLENYRRFIENAGYRKPISRIILWNISFALFSVMISFFLGLGIALVFDDLPGRRIIRTLLIIPYPIPVLVSITVWKGLLNESMGLVTKIIEGVGLNAPHFFTDKNWTRIALILINVYLSYPYFYILASGAIRSIPVDLYEAADIDGASPFQKLNRITLPLILRILMPLLIASFSFNFNNFTLIWGFNAGLPAMADSIVPMGHTDLLVSFVYRLGFSTANASNYGFAAAITVLLFLFVSTMVILQIKSTRALKED